MKSRFGQQKKKLDKLADEMRGTRQRLASLEQDAWQPRLATEADGPSDTKTRERTEGSAKAVQAMHGDSLSANRVDLDPECSASFGVKAEPPALPCRDDVSVEHGAAAQKSCLSPLEMRTTTATGGLFPSPDKISTATRTTFNQPTTRFYSTEETNSRRGTIQYTLYYSTFWRNKLLAAPSWQRVIEIKSGQNMIFDPGGSKGRLRACPFLGMWRALL